MGDDAVSEPEVDEVERAVENRILADALRQLDEIEPDESDDWRIDPIGPIGPSVCRDAGS